VRKNDQRAYLTEGENWNKSRHIKQENKMGKSDGKKTALKPMLIALARGKGMHMNLSKSRR